MAECTVQNVLDDVRAYLSDTQVQGGEVFTNNYLLGVTGSGTSGSGSLFGEPYRTMYSKIMGGSKRVENFAYIVLPGNTTVVIPSTYGIVDFSEPEMIEERPATSTAVPIASTDTSTPINVATAAPHNLGEVGSQVEGTISGVLGTAAPCGNWFATITGASAFSLNGSASDGVAGTGGSFYQNSNYPFSEVFASDFANSLDGAPQGVLGNYIWSNGRLQFRGATSAIQLRITYYASGTAPTNPNYVIWIDNCRDFLAYATAANAAFSKGWQNLANTYRGRAYGDPFHPEELSLLDLFFMGQVLAAQRGPDRRQLPFRDHRYRWGAYLLA